MTNMYYVLLPTYYDKQCRSFITFFLGEVLTGPLPIDQKEWELRSMCYPIYKSVLLLITL